MLKINLENKFKNALQRIGKRKTRLGVKILNNFRNLYNKLCRNCQLKLITIVRDKPNQPIDPKKLCNGCRATTVDLLTRTNKLMLKGQK